MDDCRNPQPIDILLVEDNIGDIELTKEALEESKIFNNLHIVQDGCAAMEFLKKQNDYKSSPTPDLILLDLNLPCKNGIQVLEEIKSTPDLKFIPVVILTTSKSEEDILTTYNLHANCFISKPVNFEQFIEVVNAIDYFWFSIVKLPKKEY